MDYPPKTQVHPHQSFFGEDIFISDSSINFQHSPYQKIVSSLVWQQTHHWGHAFLMFNNHHRVYTFFNIWEIQTEPYYRENPQGREQQMDREQPNSRFFKDTSHLPGPIPSPGQAVSDSRPRCSLDECSFSVSLCKNVFCVYATAFVIFSSRQKGQKWKQEFSWGSKLPAQTVLAFLRHRQ